MNKGFTLAELISILTILGILMIISVPTFVTLYNDTKRNNLINKISYLNTVAMQYAETIKDDIKNNNCLDISIKDLIEKGYLVSDENEKDVFTNPITNSPLEGKIRICYCPRSLDLNVNYYEIFNEKDTYNINDIVLENGSLYKCVLKYKNGNGINSSKNGKRYFEKIGC